MKTIVGVLVVSLLSLAAMVQAAIVIDNPRPINMTWNDNSNDETGFVIERNLNGGAFVVLFSTLSGNVTSYTDGMVVQSSTVDNVYCYRVKAVKDTLSSGYSNTDCATIRMLPPPPTPPAAPSGFTTSAVDGDTLESSWMRTALDATAFEIVRYSALTGAQEKRWTLAPTAVRYRDNGLPRLTTKCYQARNVVGEVMSPWTDWSCATTR